MFEWLSHLCNLLFSALQKNNVNKTFAQERDDDRIFDKNVFKIMSLLNNWVLICSGT